MGRKRKEKLENILFTIPAIIMVVITIYIPFIMSGYYSFMDWNGIAKVPKFIGLKNFKTIFAGSSTFLDSLVFTGKYTILFIIFSNIIAIAIAVPLAQKSKIINFMRGMFFVPYILSMTIVGFIWKFIFSQGFEVLYEKTGLFFLNWSWLGDATYAFFAITFVGIWQSLGFYVVLYIAGLQAVSKDVLEAARVDGASPWKTFFKVTLPLLGPSITTCIFMSLTNAVKVFDIILALTKGGPGGATHSVTLDIYREAFQNNNYGLGSAKSLVFFVIILVITQIILSIMKSKEVEI